MTGIGRMGFPMGSAGSFMMTAQYTKGALGKVMPNAEKLSL